jgi:hypothetical protein
LENVTRVDCEEERRRERKKRRPEEPFEVDGRDR